MVVAAGMTIDGTTVLIRKLAMLPGYVEHRGVKVGITKAATVIAKEVRRRAPRKSKKKGTTGLTKRAVGRVVRRYKKNKIYLALVGVRKEEKFWGTRRGKVHKPHMIAKFLEKGHAKGKGRSAAPAYPFVEPGFEAARGRAESILVNAIRAGVLQGAVSR